MPAKRIAVILAAHGEAETAGFLENYRVSLHTLQRASELIAVPAPLRHFISFSFSLPKKAADRGGLLQNPLARRQTSELQKQLDRLSPASCPGISFEVMAAFSVFGPFVEALVGKTRLYDGRIIVPMAPVDNTLICGLLCAHLAPSQPRPPSLLAQG